MGVANFWLCAFRLPGVCLKQIESLCSAFLWSGPDLNSRKAKVSWEDVCRPRNEGGLGIRRLKDINTVCGLKLLWRIVSCPSSLWVTWLRTYLIRKGSFWSVKLSAQSGSWMWKKVLKLRSLAQSFHRVKVHNGQDTSFWFDNWSGMGRLQEILGDRGHIDMGISITATVAEVMLSHRRRRHRHSTLIQLEDAIEKQRQCLEANKRDLALWRHQGNVFKAKFSSKHTWYQIRQPQNQQPWAKCIWFSSATPKYTFLSWLALQNRLSTGDRTQLWNQSTHCVLCNHTLESRNHIFFECAYASEVWGKLVKGIMRNRFTPLWSGVLDFLLNASMNYIECFLMKYIFQAVIYGVWRERNQRKHGEKASPPSRLIKLIEKNVRNRLITARSAGNKKLEDGLMFWFSVSSST